MREKFSRDLESRKSLAWRNLFFRVVYFQVEEEKMRSSGERKAIRKQLPQVPQVPQRCSGDDGAAAAVPASVSR